MKIHVMKKLYMVSIYGLVTKKNKLKKNIYIGSHGKTAVISDFYIDFLFKNSCK
jgi:hypothetical protein